MIPQSALLSSFLVGIFALIGLAVKLVRQRMWTTRAQAGRVLMLRETIAIDPRRRLHLIECGDRRVIVLTGGGQDLVVGWLPER